MKTIDKKKCSAGAADGVRDPVAYTERVLSELQAELPGLLDQETVRAGQETRKLNMPETETEKSVLRGKWDESTFVLDDDFVPARHNEEGLSISEIRKELSRNYGIELKGIPFVDGVADFRSISLANISTEDIFRTANGMSEDEYRALLYGDQPDGVPGEDLRGRRLKMFQATFDKSRRNDNFEIADRLAAERQIPIPGLKSGYSWKELREWRKQNGFTWDEQLHAGYNLVPSVIHGNLSHTGTVGTIRAAAAFFSKQEAGYWNDSEAPTSVDELLSGAVQQKKHKHTHERNKSEEAKTVTHGTQLGKSGMSDSTILKKEVSDAAKEHKSLQELGEGYKTDKKKIDDAMERVEKAEIPDADKAKLKKELQEAEDQLVEYYSTEIEEEQHRLEEKIDNIIAAAEAAAQEQASLAEDLENAGSASESGHLETTDAAAEARRQQEEFEKMTSDTETMLELQMQQAADQRRAMRSSRLSRN